MSSKIQWLSADRGRRVPRAILSILVSLGAVMFAQAPEAACFKIMDATLYSGKPDLKQYGIQHVTMVEPQRWWKVANADASGRHAASVQNAKGLAGNQEPVIIDLELPITRSTPGADENIKQYLDVVSAMREAGYDRPLAFYGSLPGREYWRALKGPGTPGYRDWQADNDRGSAIVPKVSALYPSLYTLYEDQAGWVKYAEANVAEAKRIGQGRPVYPFLWPQYHDSAHALAYQYLPPAYWSLQLRTMAQVADGLVLWGGWDFTNGRPQPWDDTAPWWQATLAFIRSQHNVCAAQ